MNSSLAQPTALKLLAVAGAVAYSLFRCFVLGPLLMIVLRPRARWVARQEWRLESILQYQGFVICQISCRAPLIWILFCRLWGDKEESVWKEHLYYQPDHPEYGFMADLNSQAETAISFKVVKPRPLCPWLSDLLRVKTP